jgi:hypothetical protein
MAHSKEDDSRCGDGYKPLWRFITTTSQSTPLYPVNIPVMLILSLGFADVLEMGMLPSLQGQGR